MVQSVSSGIIHLNHATYSNSVEIRSAAGRGRGLFSTAFIKAGSLVLCENAFCLPDMYCEDKPKDAALFLQLRQKLYGDLGGGENERFWDLDAGGYVRSGKEGVVVDGVPVVDSFLIEAIRLKNCFSCPRLSLDLLQAHLSTQPSAPTLLSTGLWIKASYINHSCLPNLTRAFIGDMMLIHANSDIPPNTELTQQYLAPEAHFLTRRKELPLHWDFACDCPLCSTEGKSPDEMHQQRRDLVTKIKDQALKAQSQHTSHHMIPNGTIKTIERLTRKLEELHESDVYADLPRLLLVHPSIWLTDAHHSRGNHAKVVTYALEILRNFGFVDPVKEGKLCLAGPGRGITNCESFSALRVAAEAYKALGNRELAEQCEEAARGMFVALTGSEVYDIFVCNLGNVLHTGLFVTGLA
ncbi:TPR domain-containing protein [Leptodontidium sp. MPI-SDFR-AT-0119]|nr:TPR domain-containing protein [Leptodontidium sp. MPI-SDFR-AT-0119]